MRTETLLLQMRTEQREDHQEVLTRIEALSSTMVAHASADIEALNKIDKRMMPIEHMRQTVRWALGILFAAIIPVIADACIHLKNWSHP